MKFRYWTFTKDDAGCALALISLCAACYGIMLL